MVSHLRINIEDIIEVDGVQNKMLTKCNKVHYKMDVFNTIDSLLIPAVKAQKSFYDGSKKAKHEKIFNDIFIQLLPELQRHGLLDLSKFEITYQKLLSIMSALQITLEKTLQIHQ